VRQKYCSARTFPNLFSFFQLFFVALRPKSDLGPLAVEAADNTRLHTHTHTHTHPVGLLCTSDQLVAETASSVTHDKWKRRTFMPSAGFEPAIPTIERLQTYALDCN